MIAKINIDLEYRDFYNILELLQDTEKPEYYELRDRFLKIVFDLASEKEWTSLKEWTPLKEFIKFLNSTTYPNVNFYISGRKTTNPLQHGSMIATIKNIRMISDISLRGAKDFVDILSEFAWTPLSQGSSRVVLNSTTTSCFTGLDALSDDPLYEFEVKVI